MQPRPTPKPLTWRRVLRLAYWMGYPDPTPAEIEYFKRKYPDPADKNSQ